MRRTPRAAAPSLGLVALACLLSALSSSELAAAPQHHEQQIREIVVVGSQPTHRRMILEQLANRGYLGVHLLHLTPELRRHFGAPDDSGVLVSRIAPDSPAAAAGVAVGDVIISVDGEPLSTTGQLVGRIGHRQKGDEVELGVVRDRASLTLRATLAQSERRQVEVGQFVWSGGEEGPFVGVLDPDEIERVITVDPETINESVRGLLERLEAQGGLRGRLRLEGEQRERLEQRIAELEERLRQMERLLHRQHD
ncbi:MAG: PDZ domain-containing protein [Thermoanaerobaculia bacterium]